MRLQLTWRWLCLGWRHIMWLYDVKHLSSSLISHNVNIKECYQMHLFIYLSGCFTNQSFMIIGKQNIFAKWHHMFCTMIDIVLIEGWNRFLLAAKSILKVKNIIIFFQPSLFLSPILVLWFKHSGREWCLTKRIKWDQIWSFTEPLNSKII